MKIVWHYGWDRANSSLIIKVPEREVTFVSSLLACWRLLEEALSNFREIDDKGGIVRSPWTAH